MDFYIFLILFIKQIVNYIRNIIFFIYKNSEKDPQEQCNNFEFDLKLISASDFFKKYTLF